MASRPEFIKSAVFPEDFPKHEGVEFAFLGASNSGKSSLVNKLLGSNLCKTSSKPGHTSLINFFSAKKGIYFVDLPGYGYAKKSRAEQKKWQEAIERYLIQREQLTLCYVLFDLKRGIMDNDQMLIEWLKAEGLPFTLVATKVDKLNQKQKSAQIKKAKARSLDVPIMQSSSVKGLGIKELWAQMEGSVEAFM